MRYQLLTSILLVAISITACKQKDQGRENDNSTLAVKLPSEPVDTAKVKDKIGGQYHSDLINWTISTPEGWQILDQAQLEAYDQQAEALLSPEQEGEERPKVEYLIAFQKDDYNQFSSMLEPYTERYPGEYKATFQDIKNNIYTAFRVQNVNVDTSSGVDTFSGIPFLRYHTAIYDQNFVHIMNQVMYSTMYKGYDFSINITYRGDENFKFMKALLDSSKFE